MDELVEIISFSLSIVALFSMFTLLAVKIYFKIRRCFPISVNCWFCNTWTRVPYDNQNCFDCPSCLQYNGFTEDGGYNKVIEAQHKFIKTPKSKSHRNSNGLCTSCNHNQQLKISQLAKFTPLIEENYDEEIEHFRNQLEKAYELCRPCKKFLKNTLLREKANFLGNHVFNIQKKGRNLYERLIKKSAVCSSRPHLLGVLRGIQGLLAILVILKITSDVLNSLQPDWFPVYLLPYLQLYQDISTSLSSMIKNKIFTSFSLSSGDFEFNNLWVYSSIGFFIHLPLLSMEQTLMCIKINQFLCWSFLALLSWTKSQEMLMSSFQIVCACLIFYNSFYEFQTTLSINKTMKKLPRSCNTSCDSDDFSDNEEDFKSYNHHDSMFNKTENLTANNIFNRMSKTTRSGSKSSPTYRSDLQNLNLSKSTLTLETADPLLFSRSSSPKNKQGLISPSKLSHIDQNSWVAGGFWKSDDGTLIPINPNATKSYSQSSGFCSQVNGKFPSVFNSDQFHSLPTSIETSLSGDFDRLSLAPKSPYVSPSASPPVSRMENLNYASPNHYSSPHNSFNSWTSNQSFVKYMMPPAPLGLHRIDTPVGLFKSSLGSAANSPNSTYINRNFGMPRSSL
ncbi:uncharacterized protein LOC123313601 [Coccinella septempunctata]|uniref:uncharacterized protein LOC123313601 n=1 Tax=Coccinella septempunctata TaxID=41139 RepID=UPI001D0949E0|nr:uncharacterized protein LOC123313601 [Coccinella septempunctata]